MSRASDAKKKVLMNLNSIIRRENYDGKRLVQFLIDHVNDLGFMHINNATAGPVLRLQAKEEIIKAMEPWERSSYVKFSNPQVSGFLYWEFTITFT